MTGIVRPASAFVESLGRLCRISTPATVACVESTMFDTFDQSLIHGLAVAPRASFRQLADVLGASDQTVARRYRRFQEEGSVQVLGRLDARRLGYVDWLLRLQCEPDAAPAVAASLARRDDTSWIKLASGGTEVMCAVQVRSAAQRDALLLQKLPGTRQVTGMSAHWVLHVFARGTNMWGSGQSTLGDDQIAALRATAPAVADPPDEPMVLDDEDRRLTDVLAKDGRAGYAQLAAATGLHESTARRRVEHLYASGALVYETDVDTSRLGINALAMLYMSVAPTHLATVGAALADLPEVPFVAATTGTHNLVASVACRDAHALYDCLALRIGTLDAVDAVEAVPVLRTFKRVGTVGRRR
jgi:DNA-binding Lrp family transcriptional regulator